MSTLASLPIIDLDVFVSSEDEGKRVAECKKVRRDPKHILCFGANLTSATPFLGG